MRTIGINQIIIYIMVLFAMIGAADRIIGNRLGLGQKFEEGILSMRILTSSMLGATIAFTMPLVLGGPMGGKEKAPLAKGILIGAITIPVGVFTGGIAAGFPLRMVSVNVFPILVISLLLALGMWKLERILILCFLWVGRTIMAFSIFGLAVGILAQLTEIHIFKETMPLTEIFLIVGNIAIVLAGAFPLVGALTRVFRRPLANAGKRLGINETSAAGFLVTLANTVPMYGMLENMDFRGKVMNMAFSVSAICMLGDHLSYTAGANIEMLMPLIVGKLTAGVTAAVLAWVVMRDKPANI